MNEDKHERSYTMDESEEQGGLSEAERLAKIREQESRPAVNPRYQGLTPGEIARSLFRPRNPKIAKIMDALRSRD